MTSDHEPDSPQDADDLVVRAKVDRDAFGQLYDGYYDRIYRHCVRRAFSRSAAEELCSEVFLYVAANMQRFRGTTENEFRGWIYGIATTTINAHFRRTRRRDELMRQAIASDALRFARDERAVATDFDLLDFPQLHQSIARLKLRDQAIVTMRYFDGLGFDEIATALRLKPATARVALSRALERLRLLLCSHDSSPRHPHGRV